MAFAVWERPERSRLIGLLGDAMEAAGADRNAGVPDGPDDFRYADTGRMRRLLEGAGLGEVEVTTVELDVRAGSPANCGRGRWAAWCAPLPRWPPTTTPPARVPARPSTRSWRSSPRPAAGSACPRSCAWARDGSESSRDRDRGGAGPGHRRQGRRRPPRACSRPMWTSPRSPRAGTGTPAPPTTSWRSSSDRGSRTRTGSNPSSTWRPTPSPTASAWATASAVIDPARAARPGRTGLPRGRGRPDRLDAPGLRVAASVRWARSARRRPRPARTARTTAPS